MQTIYLFFFSILLSVSSFAHQQDAYHSVQLGTFVDARISDFDAIRPHGFVYADPLNDNQHRIFIGGAYELRKAEALLDVVRNKGYLDAFVTARPMARGKEIIVVQLAIKGINEPINWAKYLNVGRIHTITEGETVKIISGTYPNKAAAEVRLEKARNMGFQDAFTRPINSMLLHQITPFETGGLAPDGGIVLVDETALMPATQDVPIEADYVEAKGGEESTLIVFPAGEPIETTEELTARSAPPSISTQRSSDAVKWFQEVLQQEGVYNEALDAYYGNATATAWETAKIENYQLQKYYIIYHAKNDSRYLGDFRDWETVQLLKIISYELAPAMGNGNTNTIKALFETPQLLDDSDIQTIVSWDYRFRRNLRVWALEDPLHFSIAQALKMTYLRSQILLENFYAKKGFNAEQSKALALTTLKELVGAELQRFQ